LNKFNFAANNGWIFGATFQHSFSEIYLAADSIKSNPHRLKAFTVSILFQQDKFNVYSPESNEVSLATPQTIAIKGGYSLYKFRYRGSAKLKYSYIPSVYGKINLRAHNGKDLKNYILNANSSP